MGESGVSLSAVPVGVYGETYGGNRVGSFHLSMGGMKGL